MVEEIASGGRGRSGAIGAARQQSILSLIARGDVIAIGEFAERFGVSQETIRRDIRTLEEAGQLRRVHGGAAPMRATDLTARRPVAERLDVDRDAKIMAARAAMPLFEDDMNVFIGASSTMLFLAEELAKHDRRLTVTTNMIDVALIMGASPRCEVILLGGKFNPATRSIVGFETVRAIGQHLFDLAVLGCSGISAEHGVLSATAMHVEFAHIVGEHAHRLAFVADGGKFGRSDAYIVQNFAKIHAIATDREPAAEYREALSRAGVSLLLPAF